MSYNFFFLFSLLQRVQFTLWNRWSCRVVQSWLTLCRTQCYPTGGGRVCTPRMRWCCIILKPVQWQWISAVPSMSMNDEGHFHMSDISWPAWLPNLTVLDFLLWASHVLESMHIQELSTQNTGVEAFYPSWNCDCKSRAVAWVLGNCVNHFKTVCYKWRRQLRRCYLSKAISR